MQLLPSFKPENEVQKDLHTAWTAMFTLWPSSEVVSCISISREPRSHVRKQQVSFFFSSPPPPFFF